MFGIGATESLVLVLMLPIYFLPSFIAWRRHHQNAGSILLVNCFLGWSVVGWIAAFIWSLTAAQHPAAPT